MSGPTPDDPTPDVAAGRRRSIDVDAFRHSSPIPGATRVGPLLTSSIIVARDPGGTTVPGDLDGQIENLFRHVGALLHAAGADWHHVAKMTFYLPNPGDRAALDGPWVEHFPDPSSRPSRHTRPAPGDVAQCDFIAFVS